MAYDMNNPSVPSPTAPLIGGSFNDTEALQQFTSVVPASKVILGVPYYGYDWPTTDGSSTAQATGGEAPLSDSVITSSGEPTYWDPSTQTAWTSYQVGTQWHETYFDDPTSLALKAATGQLVPHRRGRASGPSVWTATTRRCSRRYSGTRRPQRTSRPGRTQPRRAVRPAPASSPPASGTGRHGSPHSDRATGSGGSQQFLGTLSGFAHHRSCARLPAERASPQRLVVQHDAGRRRGGGGPTVGLRERTLRLHPAGCHFAGVVDHDDRSTAEQSLVASDEPASDHDDDDPPTSDDHHDDDHHDDDHHDDDAPHQLVGDLDHSGVVDDEHLARGHLTPVRRSDSVDRTNKPL